MTRYVIRAPSREVEARRASCEIAGRRFETQGPAPIYKITTLLWLHGHGGAAFEVYDDLSPTGKPGGLAMRGKVRNWSRLERGKPVFDKDAPSEVEFLSYERDLIAQAAGSAVKIASARPENAGTAATHPSDGPEYPQDEDGASARVVTAHTPEAA